MAGKIGILLVEDDRKMRKAFEFCIERNPGFHLIGSTGKQVEGIEFLKTGKVNAVILDLELEEGDGIHFLSQMKMLDIELPLVVVITNNRSETILSYIRAEGVDFICQKCNESYSPMTVLSIVERTYPFHNKKRNVQMEVITYQQSKEEEYRKNRIEDELRNLEFKMTSKSAEYLIDAIYYTTFKIKESNYTIKEVYEKVAEDHHTKAANVERVIRSSIEKVWEKTNPVILERYYPYEVSKDSGCPTNSEFIKNMAARFRRI